MMKKCLVFLLSLTFLHASVIDRFNPLSDRAQIALQELDGVIEQALEQYHVPGVAIALVVDDAVVSAKGFGLRDVEHKLPVTADTVFPIGSCTKAFTSFIAGTLVEEGVLYWDQRIVDILPDFRLFDEYATRHLTLRDLLAHRSGLPRHDFMWYNSDMTREELMRKIRHLEPSYELRERYQYNNLMYMTAGVVMEKMMKKSWETLVAERILQPLGMQHTHFSLKELLQESEISLPYIEKGGQLKQMQWRDISLIGPAGSMHSTVNDLARWIRLQLNEGIFERQELIHPSTLKEMHSSQMVVSDAPEVNEFCLNAYGMGWGLSSYRGEPLVSHDGGVDGFTSVIGLLPQRHIGIVILANRNLTTLPRLLALQVIDRILNLPFIDWLKRGLDGAQKGGDLTKEMPQKGEEPLRKQGTTPSHPLEAFVGDFEHPGYGTLSVKQINGQLHGTLNGLSFRLDHWHYDVFTIAEEMQDVLFSREGMKITFRSNVKGEIDELSIPLEPKVRDITFLRKSEEAHMNVAYLRQFTGLYEVYGVTVEIAIRNRILSAIIPGQPLYQLLPTGQEGEFTVKSMTGNSVRFILNEEGKVKEVWLVRPYATFVAKPVMR